MNPQIIMWLILIVLLLAVEGFTMALTTIWFAAGAVFALIMAACHVPLAFQIVVFVIVSLGLLILTRPIAMRYFNKDRIKTNVEAVVGKKALVYETIDNLHATGRVTINGMEWSARAFNAEEIIEPGETVTVKAVSGNKVLVEK